MESYDTLEEAQKAAQAKELLHLACDQGQHTHPRYRVILAPQFDDEVSRAFNGDYYSAGKIIRISGSLRRIQTSDGTVFWRQKQSAAWVANKTWSMVRGHKNERNPSF